MVKIILVFFITCILVSLGYNLAANVKFKELQLIAKVIVVMIFSALTLFLITLFF